LVHSGYDSENLKRETHFQTNKINLLGIRTIWTMKEIIRKKKKSSCIKHWFSYVWPNRHFPSLPYLLLAAIFLWTENTHWSPKSTVKPIESDVIYHVVTTKYKNNNIHRENIKSKKTEIIIQIVEIFGCKKIRKHVLIPFIYIYLRTHYCVNKKHNIVHNRHFLNLLKLYNYLWFLFIYSYCVFIIYSTHHLMIQIFYVPNLRSICWKNV